MDSILNKIGEARKQLIEIGYSGKVVDEIAESNNAKSNEERLANLLGELAYCNDSY
ncbi:hypothetical protein [Clostridium brassicae]|uniref:Uncharacterized protein n=1 Tax=Clostridium brassicae TaxID=2999072 RepID=A0ABT4D882_9CLOT|nr:hypothetical protein [Clostridium brassicae]MCY6957873.1 hypothetical protein [Clostridium brassicae]